VRRAIRLFAVVALVGACGDAIATDVCEDRIPDSVLAERES